MTATIRRAVPADVPDILRLIIDLAVYEHMSDAVNTTEDALHAKLFGPDANVFAHVAELDGRVVAIAVWFLNFSTWTGRNGLYLEDLYVAEPARRMGIARALFGVLAREAVARDCARLEWAVLDWNEGAMDFYRRLGGAHSTGWQPWRLDGDALARLAAE